MAFKKIRKFGTGGPEGSTIESGDSVYIPSSGDVPADNQGSSSEDPQPESPDWGAFAAAIGAPSITGAAPSSDGTNYAWTQAAQESQAAPAQDMGYLGKALKGLGLSNGKDGLAGINFTDPNVMAKLGKYLTAAESIYGALSGSNKPPPVKTVSEIRNMFASPFNGFTPAGQAAYTRMNSTPYASRTPHALRGYADGGGIDDTQPEFISSGALGQHYTGGGHAGGQDDVIPARLASGEYVFDADAVAAAGDGSNDEGARRLDTMRENLRAHKRSAPADKIPPKAKPLESYMPKGKK